MRFCSFLLLCMITPSVFGGTPPGTNWLQYAAQMTKLACSTSWDFADIKSVTTSFCGRLSLQRGTLPPEQWPVVRMAEARVALSMMTRLVQWTNVNESATSHLLNVAPPMETGLPSGVDPQVISDRTLRSRYEQDIAENRRKANASIFYAERRNDSLVYLAFLKSYVINWYSIPPVADEELRTVVKDANLPDALAIDILQGITHGHDRPASCGP